MNSKVFNKRASISLSILRSCTSIINKRYIICINAFSKLMKLPGEPLQMLRFIEIIIILMQSTASTIIMDSTMITPVS